MYWQRPLPHGSVLASPSPLTNATLWDYKRDPPCTNVKALPLTDVQRRTFSLRRCTGDKALPLADVQGRTLSLQRRIGKPLPRYKRYLPLTKATLTILQMRIGKALPLTDVQGRTLSLRRRIGDAFWITELQ